jgi:hypothetical protein
MRGEGVSDLSDEQATGRAHKVMWKSAAGEMIRKWGERRWRSLVDKSKRYRYILSGAAANRFHLISSLLVEFKEIDPSSSLTVIAPMTLRSSNRRK